MVRLFKKWRLVRRLRKECLGHIGKQGDGFVSRERTVWVSKGAFAEQTIEHLWRARHWSEEHKAERLHQIHSLLDSCIAEKFIDAFLREDGVRFIKASLAGEDFCGFTDFLESCFARYHSVATIIIVPLLTFALGFFAPTIFKKLSEKPPQKVYQAPTPAEAIQVTSPLTTQERPSKDQDAGTSGINSSSWKAPHKEQKPASPNTPPPTISQDCGGGNCAVSSGQTGGITAGQINLPGAPAQVHIAGVKDIPPKNDGNDDPSEFKYEKEVTVTVTGTYTPVSIALKCDSSVKKVNALFRRPWTSINPNMGVSSTDSSIAYVYFEGTPATPDDPLIVHIWSDAPFSVLEVGQARLTHH
jgi:hypothetical protein